MGAGKTSVGRLLATRLKWRFEDLDDRIARREKHTVSEIFRTSGEADFRRAERNALQEVLEELRSGGEARVVALGGGAFVQPEIAAMLETAEVSTIFLDAPLAQLWQRCQSQASAEGADRPLLSSRERFSELYRNRREGYLRATIRIDTGGRSVEAAAKEIARLLEKKNIGKIH
jgi:shikimate kinase